MGGDPERRAATGEPARDTAALNMYFTGRADLGDGWMAARPGQLRLFVPVQPGMVGIVITKPSASEMHSDGVPQEGFRYLHVRRGRFAHRKLPEHRDSDHQSPTEASVICATRCSSTSCRKRISAAAITPSGRIFRSGFPSIPPPGLHYRLAPVFEGNKLVNTFPNQPVHPRLRFAPHVSTALHLVRNQFHSQPGPR